MAIKTPQGTTCDLKEYSTKDLSEDEIENFADVNDLKYYNFDIHIGSFAMPNEYRKIFKEI